VSENVKGTSFYVDLERIRKHDGHVYWWELVDFSKPTEYGHLSGKTYSQGDCKLFRSKYLSATLYKEPMGEGTGETRTISEKWDYPPPDSSNETILKRVCAYAN